MQERHFRLVHFYIPCTDITVPIFPLLHFQLVHFQSPLVWNNLPLYIRAEPDIARFKNTLKTYFFKLAYDLLG